LAPNDRAALLEMGPRPGSIASSHSLVKDRDRIERQLYRIIVQAQALEIFPDSASGHEYRDARGSPMIVEIVGDNSDNR
jgi:hypothetical protein